MAVSQFTADVPVSAVVGLTLGSGIPGLITVTDLTTSLHFTPSSLITGRDVSATIPFYMTIVIADEKISQVDAELTFYLSPWLRENTIIARQTFTRRVGAVQTTPTTAPVSSITSTSISSTATTTPSLSQSSSSSTLSSTTTPQPTHAAGKTYTSVDLAGAAVGCGIGVALLAGFAAFVFFRRRAGRRDSHNTLASAVSFASASSPRKTSVAVNGIYDDGYEMATSMWAKHLPQAESDQSIRIKTNSILDAIATYVETFYQDKASMPLNTSAETDMRDLESSHLPCSIVTLMKESDKPTHLIKHCITNLILSRITFEQSDPESSFLPEYMTSMKVSTEAHDQPGSRQALSQWRIISAYLRQEPQNDQRYRAQRDEKIARIAAKLCNAMGGWARDSAGSKRVEHITGIMQRASDLGVLLVSQRATFEWQWHDQTRGITQPGKVTASPVIILPGLYKVTGEDAMPLASPVHLIEPQFS